VAIAGISSPFSFLLSLHSCRGRATFKLQAGLVRLADGSIDGLLPGDCAGAFVAGTQPQSKEKRGHGITLRKLKAKFFTNRASFKGHKIELSQKKNFCENSILCPTLPCQFCAKPRRIVRAISLRNLSAFSA
jgi:hypothetical protein